MNRGLTLEYDRYLVRPLIAPMYLIIIGRVEKSTDSVPLF